MHEGVLRDLDMQQRRKIENIYVLERQKDLTKRLQQMASQISSSSGSN